MIWNSHNELINIIHETAVQMERIGIYPWGGLRTRLEITVEMRLLLQV